MKITYRINGECWECTSHKTDANGYPVASINKIWDRIHRHSYRMYKGDIPKDCVVRHTCDNRLCVNPDHLIIGTHADNVSDRVNRHRSAVGERNGRSKLTESDVMSIRKNTTIPNMTLAKLYGVDSKVIRNIKCGKTWKHVT